MILTNIRQVARKFQAVHDLASGLGVAFNSKGESPSVRIRSQEFPCKLVRFMCWKTEIRDPGNVGVCFKVSGRVYEPETVIVIWKHT